MSEWREFPLRDIAARERNALVGGPFGSNLLSRDFTSTGTPVIRGENMGQRWVSGPFVHVGPEKAIALRANVARPGDVIFTQRGTVGQVSLVPAVGPAEYIVSQSQMKLTADRSLADPMYLYYVLSSQPYRDHMRRHAIQTGVPHTNLGILGATLIALPPLSVQRRIAGILGTLDDKIELNRRLAETLETAVLAPFGAQVQQDQLPADQSRLGDLAILVRDLVDPRSSPEVEFDHYSLPAFDDGQRPAHDLGQSIKSVKTVVPPGCVLVSKLNPEIERVWCPDVGPGDRAVCSTEFMVLLPVAPMSRGYLYALTRSRYFRRALEALVTGTSGSHQRANVAAAMEIPVHRADPAWVDRFQAVAEPMLDRALSTRREAQSLATIRDALLPRLLAGPLGSRRDRGAGHD